MFNTRLPQGWILLAAVFAVGSCEATTRQQADQAIGRSGARNPNEVAPRERTIIPHKPLPRNPVVDLVRTRSEALGTALTGLLAAQRTPARSSRGLGRAVVAHLSSVASALGLEFLEDGCGVWWRLPADRADAVTLRAYTAVDGPGSLPSAPAAAGAITGPNAAQEPAAAVALMFAAAAWRDARALRPFHVEALVVADRFDGGACAQAASRKGSPTYAVALDGAFPVGTSHMGDVAVALVERVAWQTPRPGTCVPAPVVTAATSPPLPFSHNAPTATPSTRPHTTTTDALHEGSAAASSSAPAPSRAGPPLSDAALPPPGPLETSTRVRLEVACSGVVPILAPATPGNVRLHPLGDGVFSVQADVPRDAAVALQTVAWANVAQAVLDLEGLAPDAPGVLLLQRVVALGGGADAAGALDLPPPREGHRGTRAEVLSIRPEGPLWRATLRYALSPPATMAMLEERVAARASPLVTVVAGTDAHVVAPGTAVMVPFIKAFQTVTQNRDARALAMPGPSMASLHPFGVSWGPRMEPLQSRADITVEELVQMTAVYAMGLGELALATGPLESGGSR